MFMNLILLSKNLQVTCEFPLKIEHVTSLHGKYLGGTDSFPFVIWRFVLLKRLWAYTLCLKFQIPFWSIKSPYYFCQFFLFTFTFKMQIDDLGIIPESGLNNQ